MWKSIIFASVVALAGSVAWAQQTPGKHYANGEAIPGVGFAMGDVYVLPNGEAYGVGTNSGIHWSNGAMMFFGNTVTAKNGIRITQPGSPATK